ncbi:probable 28S ribosomal protein S10, mitochondrial [Nematolebias whitei]|uniref:probable 28S ribosomal protein S10, mitochondrial n=1 Tax=Nematolebias whitei TaxID=451745 RepID=UPI00189AF32E|nr:probable 28S ribosomal protein S10, mitochondrial [Nematolebias whitei]
MAACLVLRRQLFSLTRIFCGPSHTIPRALSVCSSHKSNLTRINLPQTCNSVHVATLSTTPTITVTEEPDTLIQKVAVLVKGHDRAVLDSYEFFATMAAKELGISIGKISEPRYQLDRLTVLKSIHIYKKHRVQYEMRTYYRCIELLHVTGCTAQVYLEYIQRNLPEGVAMEVTKTTMEKVPEHIHESMWKDHPTDDKPSQ